MGHAGLRQFAGVLPELLFSRVESPPGRDTWPADRACRSRQPWREVVHDVRAGLPGTICPNFLNSEIGIPEVLSNLGAGVVNVSLVDSLDALHASSVSHVFAAMRVLVPFRSQGK